MNRSDYQVDILVNQKPVRQYFHNGRTYIEAKIGSEYSIRIKNNSYSRKMAVVTADGVNVVSGEAQSSGVGRGYIIRGMDSIQINGFRKDLNEVGAFKFCAKSNAYCNEKGLAGNNGVIGVRIYDEKTAPIMVGGYDWSEITNINNDSGYIVTQYPAVYYSSTTTDSPQLGFQCSTSAMNCLRSAPMPQNTPDFNAATSWGQKIKDSAIEVSFEENPNSYEEFSIFYGLKRDLQKIGICFEKKTAVSKEHPKAFGVFCQPPSGWCK